MPLLRGNVRTTPILDDNKLASDATGVSDERGAKPSLFPVVVLSRVVELTLSKLMKGQDHSRKPRSRVLEHDGRRACGSAFRIPRRVPTLRFFSPELLVLLIGKPLKAVQQPLGQTSSRLGVQALGLRLPIRRCS